MALFPQDHPLTETEINEWRTKIEQDYNASNVSFLESTTAFHIFRGTVSNQTITFSVDKKEGVIITDED
ncbi:hypothetical protein SB767_25250 [Bacillus sp. SIMBA_069]